MTTKLDWIPISKLSFLRRNPQYLTPAQMEALKKSIEKDDFLAPILVRPIGDDRFEIVSGNHRAMAAQELGKKDVPCVIRTMTDGDSRRIAINLNTVHGDPPPELLAPFLAELDDATLREIHLDPKLMKEISDFDETMKERLDAFQAPDQMNRESSTSNLPSCVCGKCGKKHAKPNDV